MAQSAEPMHGLAEEGSGTALPLRGHLALWLADTAVLMLRVAAILLLLSPLLGAAILLG